MKMETVLIVSKTKMGEDAVCVGGIIEETGESVRIKNADGGNLCRNTTKYEIGERWLVNFPNVRIHRDKPHVEDIAMEPIRRIGRVEMDGIVRKIHELREGNSLVRANFRNRLISGCLSQAFEGALKLNSSKNKCHINRDQIPSFSTQFWITDKELVFFFDARYQKRRYSYRYGETWISLPFVGEQQPIKKIPVGTMVRLSLATWRVPSGITEDRCSLQLSGWYIPDCLEGSGKESTETAVRKQDMLQQNLSSIQSSKKLGQVLLVSCLDAGFLELCRKNEGAYILDARETGWSRDPNLSRECFEARFSGRYKLVPSLDFGDVQTLEEYVSKIETTLKRIVKVLEEGASVIITNWNSSLLKILGHFILTANKNINVYLKWENQDGGRGVSMQRPMTDAQLNERFKKLIDRKNRHEV